MNRTRLSLLLLFLIAISLFAGLFSYDPAWKKISNVMPWRLGLDLAGGSFLTYEIDFTNINEDDRNSVTKGLRDVIERRVNLFGVSEPKVYNETVGDSTRLVVELAGIRDVNQAIKEIGETPSLDFREVISTEATTTLEFIRTELTGRYIKNAQVGFEQVTNEPIVNIEFNDEGGIIFENLTEKNIGKPLAIFLDDELLQLPVVQEKISGGQARISGNFTIKEARELVERFNAGALPAPITLINQQTIGADFGADALEKAVFAGALGALLVVIFMIAYYRVLGIFAALSLLMYIALTLGVFKLFGVTMTLAGIAGFILSIGMAVDANILVFERTKEELRRGLPRTQALEEGFKRAWTSIRDSNVSTIITSLILYYFTSSFVRGFALTLLMGVLVSMFSAIIITRTWLRVFTKDKQPWPGRPITLAGQAKKYD